MQLALLFACPCPAALQLGLVPCALLPNCNSFFSLQLHVSVAASSMQSNYGPKTWAFLWVTFMHVMQREDSLGPGVVDGITLTEQPDAVARTTERSAGDATLSNDLATIELVEKAFPDMGLVANGRIRRFALQLPFTIRHAEWYLEQLTSIDGAPRDAMDRIAGPTSARSSCCCANTPPPPCLCPVPCALCPVPCALCPVPCAVRCALRPAPCALRPVALRPVALRPAPCALCPAPCAVPFALCKA